MEESAGVLALLQKMETEEARGSYRRRGRVVEFCHAWIKSKLGLRPFQVRGLVQMQREMLWACLTYNRGSACEKRCPRQPGARIRKLEGQEKTESTRAAQAKKAESFSRHKNQSARDVSSQLLIQGWDGYLR